MEWGYHFIIIIIRRIITFIIFSISFLLLV